MVMEMLTQLKYKNRYGVEYSFDPVDENTYMFNMDPKEMHYMRCGGNEGEEGVDNQNLGFIDPPGGPFLSRDMDIKGNKVKRIYCKEEKFYLEV
jgi:hypothetical protein